MSHICNLGRLDSAELVAKQLCLSNLSLKLVDSESSRNVDAKSFELLLTDFLFLVLESSLLDLHSKSAANF